MIEISLNHLVFTFPEIHPGAELTITFKRTLRIPDDGSDYPLPPDLGNFPLRHIDDYRKKVPKKWLSRGGVILPMYQSEAMWVDFRSKYLFEHDVQYPFAVKIATGKINAVSGGYWENGLQAKPQNYLVVPKQPWIDGYCVEKGIVLQFVAMPLGSGYSAEEQLTGEAEHGGMQIQVYPMDKYIFDQKYPKVRSVHTFGEPVINYCLKPKPKGVSLAPGGKMRQEIYTDPHSITDWDLENTSRCFVHLTNSVHWKDITGYVPPTWLPTADDYSKAGYPWFEYYGEDPEIEAKTKRRPLTEDELEEHGYSEFDDEQYEIANDVKLKSQKNGVLSGSGILGKLKSVMQMGKKKNEMPLPENKSTEPKNIYKITNTKQVREEDF